MAAEDSLNPLGAGEEARFFRLPEAAALECLSARFRRHAYAPHTHESYVIGTIVAGCETFRIGGTRHYAGPGEFCLIEPGVVHDGAPAGDGFAYRISYPSEAVLRGAAEDAGEGRPFVAPRFASPVVRDAALAAHFAAAHRLAEAEGATLEVQERLLEVFTGLLRRHGGGAATPHGGAEEEGPVARALDYLDAHFAAGVDLVHLARVAGVPRTRLIRAMRRQTGLTPHAWLTDRRVRAARAMLAAGAAPADAAAACGFCDQSHLSRAFKPRIGVAPGAYRAAVAASLSSKPGARAVG
jgi:AraC-like DNA-binding protein